MGRIVLQSFLGRNAKKAGHGSSDTKPDEQSREGYRESFYSVRRVTKLIVQIRKRFRAIQLT